MTAPSIADPQVAAFFAALDPAMRARLLGVRAAIIAAAPGTALDESLKWGEPSYRLAARSRGKAVRLNRTPGGEAMLLFHCRTDLVARFREQFGDALEYQGNRAVVLRDVGEDLVTALARQTFAYRS